MQKTLKKIDAKLQKTLDKMLVLCAEKPLDAYQLSKYLNVTSVSIHRYAEHLICTGKMYISGYANDAQGRLQIKLYATGNLPCFVKPKPKSVTERRRDFRERMKLGIVLRPAKEPEIDPEEYLDRRKKQFKFVPTKIQQEWFSPLGWAA